MEGVKGKGADQGLCLSLPVQYNLSGHQNSLYECV